MPHNVFNFIQSKEKKCKNLIKWKYHYWIELKTLWQRKELLIMSNFSFCHNVFNNCLLQKHPKVSERGLSLLTSIWYIVLPSMAGLRHIGIRSLWHISVLIHQPVCLPLMLSLNDLLQVTQMFPWALLCEYYIACHFVMWKKYNSRQL